MCHSWLQPCRPSVVTSRVLSTSTSHSIFLQRTLLRGHSSCRCRAARSQCALIRPYYSGDKSTPAGPRMTIPNFSFLLPRLRLCANNLLGSPSFQVSDSRWVSGILCPRGPCKQLFQKSKFRRSHFLCCYIHFTSFLLQNHVLPFIMHVLDAVEPTAYARQCLL